MHKVRKPGRIRSPGNLGEGEKIDNPTEQMLKRLVTTPRKRQAGTAKLAIARALFKSRPVFFNTVPSY